MVLALLKMEVREDMSAATITAIMSPRSPGGRREVFGPQAFPAFTADPISQTHSQLVPRGSTRRRWNSGVGADRRDSEGRVGRAPCVARAGALFGGLVPQPRAHSFPQPSHLVPLLRLEPSQCPFWVPRGDSTEG